MKNLLLCSIALVMSCNTSQKTISETSKATEVKIVDPSAYAASITEEELKEHLYIYASDEYEGRETGTPGQKKAIAYLKTAYEKLGLPAAKSDGNYFQNVPLEVTKLPTGSMTVGEQEYVIGTDFVSFGESQASFNEIIYVGYGIEEGEYSDYKDLDVSGKLVIYKSGEPMNEDGTYALSGTSEASSWGSDNAVLETKVKLAEEKGAGGILTYAPKLYPRIAAYYNRSVNSESDRMSIKSDDKRLFSGLISEKMAKSIITDIDTNAIPKAQSVVSKVMAVGNSKTINSENVVAILKGSEKPNEYVVISSHLDHIGVNADGEINNGADDDGSGTVALLEIAQAFKKAADEGNGPKRSIVFLHVTGEEKGLLGSQYYTDFDPIVPLSQTVANLNIDMIGRIDPKREGKRNYIYLIGSDKLSTDLHSLSEEVNAKYANIELDYTYNDENDPNRFYYRSDHYNFAKNNIPIIFYFNGTHDDYHRPTDTPDKINYDLLQNRTRLIFHTAWEVANRDQRVIVDKASK
ncbi:M28 family peptidase [Maribacter sp. 2308TA10-17]|uniref:M28 family peptidase n=1 Tax=Maribacter sp. 2308TA10-17 TaxID=3386276 RepID=UPI0039BD22B3